MDGWTRQASNRVGRKGRLCHRLWRRGQRFASAYLFAEVAPVLPEATTVAMTLFLAAFGRNLPAGVHTVPVLDRAG